jgi:drug/metabolite transporter (DMT)-like permease
MGCVSADTPLRARERRIGTLQVLGGGFLISFSAVLVKVAHVGPTTAGFYRVLFGGLVLASIALVARHRIWNGFAPLFWAFTVVLFFAADLSMWHRSIHYVGPGLATILANFQVFFLAAVGVGVFRERADWRLLVAIPLAILGLFLLVGIDWGALGPRYRLGVVFGIGTAMAYTGYLLALRKTQLTARAISPTANLAVISLLTAGIMGLECEFQGEGFRIPDLQSWAALLAYGTLCQALGWIAITRGIARVDASRVGLMLLVQPTLTFVWDMLFFSRPTTGIELFGAGLALVAIYLGNSERRRG